MRKCIIKVTKKQNSLKFSFNYIAQFSSTITSKRFIVQGEEPATLEGKTQQSDSQL